MKPNKKFKHVYAIVRHDQWGDKQSFSVVKVVFDADYADQEVKRLNNLNQHKGCKYESQVTRLDEIREVIVVAEECNDKNSIIDDLKK
jgi:hypothetical protein